MNEAPDVAIIDYGLGNLFSIEQACKSVGMNPIVTRDTAEIRSTDGLILPGVGAFSRAMDSLRELGLVDVIKNAPRSGQPLIGICLGAQLLMHESFEFGQHEGLGLIPGSVRRINDVIDIGSETVPHVGWERVMQSDSTELSLRNVDLLDNVKDGEYMYFVHSFCIDTDEENTATTTEYGNRQFCSAVVSDNVAGFQFHPERSGPKGIQIYQNIRRMLEEGEINA
jgi:glutamine amidotransferase